MRDNTRILTWAFIFVALASAAAVIVAAFRVIPQATPTVLLNSVPSQETTNTSILSTVYDDFSNPTYDGTYNTDLWSLSGGTDIGQVYQQDGVLVLTDIANIPSNEGGRILYLRKWTALRFSYMQAKVMLSDEREGNSGNFTLNIGDFSTNKIPGGWAEFGIEHQNGGVPVIDVRFENGQGYKKTVGQYNTWYTLRLEVDTSTSTFSFYIDNNLFNTLTISDSGTDAKFQPSLQLWHPKGSSIKVFVDDVVIGLEE